MKTSFLSKALNFVKASFDNKIINFVLLKTKCEICGVRDAKWKHSYLFNYACNDCVPRGCSCRLLKKTKRAAFLIQYEYRKDRNGKEYPCEDWNKL
jgi:hypothetical protein